MIIIFFVSSSLLNFWVQDVVRFLLLRMRRENVFVFLFTAFLIFMAFLGFLIEVSIESNVASSRYPSMVRSFFENNTYLSGHIDDNISISFARVYLSNTTLRGSRLYISDSFIVVDSDASVEILDGLVIISNSFLLVHDAELRIYLGKSSILNISESEIYVEGEIFLLGGEVFLSKNIINGKGFGLDIRGSSIFMVYGSKILLGERIFVDGCDEVSFEVSNLSLDLVVRDVQDFRLRCCSVLGRLMIDGIYRSMEVVNNTFRRPAILKRLAIINPAGITFENNFLRNKRILAITNQNGVIVGGDYAEVVVIGAENITITGNISSIIVTGSRDVLITDILLEEYRSEIFIVGSEAVRICNMSASGIRGGVLFIENSSRVFAENSSLEAGPPLDIHIVNSSNVMFSNFSAIGVGSLSILDSENISIHKSYIAVQEKLLVEGSAEVVFYGSELFGPEYNKHYEVRIEIVNSSLVIFNLSTIHNLAFDIRQLGAISDLMIMNTTIDGDKVLFVANQNNMSLDPETRHAIILGAEHIEVFGGELRTLTLINVSEASIANVDHLKYLSAYSVGFLGLLSGILDEALVSISLVDKFYAEYLDSRGSLLLIGAYETTLLNATLNLSEIDISAYIAEISDIVFRETKLILEAEQLYVANTAFISSQIELKEPEELMTVDAHSNTFNGAPLEFIVNKRDLLIEDRILGGLILIGSSNITIAGISAETVSIYNSQDILLSRTHIGGTAFWCLLTSNSTDINLVNSNVDGPIKIENCTHISISNSLISYTISNEISNRLINIYYSSIITICSNSITSSYSSPIYSLASSKIYISNNTIVGYSYTVNLEESRDIIIIDNRFNPLPYERMIADTITLYLSYNISILRNNIPDSYGAINLNNTYTCNISNNDASKFRIITMLKSVLIFVYHNNLVGGAHIWIEDSKLIWILKNNITERFWSTYNPQIYMDLAELVVAEKNSLLYGVMFIPVEIYRSRRVFIIRNRSPSVMEVRIKDSSEVYVLGDFQGIVNLSAMLIWIMSLYGVVSLSLLIIFVAWRGEKSPG